MFDFIRTHQRLMQLVLLVLIVPSFALIGVGSYSTYVSGDADLVKVGDTAVTQQEFDQARRNQLQQMQQMSRGGFDPAVLDTEAARKQLLESLVDHRVVLNTAVKERFSVSDTVLRETIASMPELQVNGQFSAERYNEVLNSVGLNSRDFEQGRRSELALQRVLGPISMTASVPASVVQSIEKTLTAERTVRLRAFEAKEYENSVSISDADIQAWYDQNKKQLELPDQVSADYLLLNEAAAMQDLPAVSTEDMQKYFDQNKARYVLPARVQLSHILVNVAPGASDAQRQQASKKAHELAAKVAADKTKFAEIAKAESEDAGTAKDGGKLGWITKGSWPAALESAVFALKKGDVSQVIDGPGGYHIFKADDVQAEHGETFEQAKPKIESEIRRQLGSDRFADIASKLTGLVYDNQSSLQPAADALGLKVKTVDGIAQSRLLSASETAGSNPAIDSADAALFDDIRVRNALFAPQSFTEKQNSGVIEISPDTMIVVRVNKITPAHVQPLDKVTAQIREQLVQERALAAAEKAGQEALATLQKSPLATVPEGFGTPLTISRVNTEGLNKPVLDAAFHAPTATLPAYEGVQGPQGYVIVRIEGAQAGKTGEALLASLPGELSQAWGRAEEQAVLKTMRVEAKVKVLPEADKVLSGEVDE